MIVNEVIEDIVLGEGSRQNKGFRAGVVLFSAFIAWSIPDFGVSKNERMYNNMPFLHGMFSYLPFFYKKFLSLVGASICVILGFILPSYFHLQAFERSEMKLWEIMLDYFLLGFGVLFGILGTYQSFVNLMTGEGGGH